MPRHPGDRRQLEMPRVASNQMLPNFVRTRSLNGSSHEIGVAGQRRRKGSPQRIGEPDLGIHPPASSPLLIPTVIRTAAVMSRSTDSETGIMNPIIFE